MMNNSEMVRIDKVENELNEITSSITKLMIDIEKLQEERARLIVKANALSEIRYLYKNHLV